MAETKEVATPVVDTQETPAVGKAGAGARLAARRAAKAARKAAQRGPTEDLISDREIAEGVEAASSWLDRNQRTLWISFAALLLLGAVALTVSRNRNQASREATDALHEAEEAAIAPVIPETELAEAQAEDDRETFPTAKARAEQALSRYQAAIKGFPGTLAEHWARLGEGNSLLELGRYKDAEQAFKTVDATTEDDGVLRFRALEGYGFALEGQKRYAEAVDVFQRSAKVNNGLYRPEAELNVARMLIAENKREDALKQLQALVKSLKEQDPEAGLKNEDVLAEAEQRLAELGAPVEKTAGAGGLTPDMMEEIRRQLGSGAKVLSGPGSNAPPGAAGE